VSLVLITRQGCHLCDEALGLLHELGTTPEVVDVDTDENLFALYDWRVPVVLLDGHVVAEGKITLDQLRRALRPSTE